MFSVRRANSVLVPLAQQLAQASFGASATAGQGAGSEAAAPTDKPTESATPGQGTTALLPRKKNVEAGTSNAEGAPPAGSSGDLAPRSNRGPGPAMMGNTGATMLSGAVFHPSQVPASRSMHATSSGANALQQQVSDLVGVMDQAFTARDLDKLDEAWKGLLSIQFDVQADPAARSAHRNALSALTALHLDAQPLLNAVLNGGVDSMDKLALHFALDDDLKTLPEALQGRCQLDTNECLALSLYSVREKHMSFGPEVFRAVTALDRAPLPAAANALQFLTQPLQSGMEKLPSFNGAQLRRGMQIGVPGDMVAFNDAKAQFAAGKTIHSGAPTPGSRTAAYPGNVVLLVQSAAQDSRLKDTSAFSYVGDKQQEATFLPGTSMQITRADEQTVPSKWAAEDSTVESSGRKWRDLVGQPVLVVQAKEMAAGAPST